MNVPLATAVAAIVHEGFDTFYAEFKRLTREARRWFDSGDWIRLRDLNHERIDLYQHYVSRTCSVLRPITVSRPQDADLWREAHMAYAGAIAGRVDFEVAETFFNAITRKVFRTVGVNHEIEFLDGDFDTRRTVDAPLLYRRLPSTDDPVDVLSAVLSHPRPAFVWRDLSADARWLAERHAAHCERTGVDPRFDAVEVLRSTFVRAPDGYIVARFVRHGSYQPLLVAVQPTPDGMVVDGALFDVDEMLQVFSSTRSYFFVEVDRPSDLVRFLGSLMPQLTDAERYISIAHHRHGKTLIHRELMAHLRQSSDQFVMAPGIPGLVMTVFTLPSYRNVFKVIRDRFDKPGATREGILRSYRDVFRGNRIGRLADTQEFEHLAFSRSRFTADCLAELQSKAAGSIRVDGDEVVVAHLYTEEKMTPLNLYLEQATQPDAVRAIVDYGHAIKELAASDVFAGDLLWKNFGVTRHGRLVLYDYDEICPLLDCRFRSIPKAQTYDDELSDQPYYAVSEYDVFPEEWAPFIVPRDPALRAAFLDHHADLLTAEFWRRKQAAVANGEIDLGLPYAPRG